ncbi:MAG: hypothetical protein E6J41_16865 [Chloroflexi bacterium]|nr:MAG: hypothetical protein E6J41_16865 [Chloroflexota bacterium]
MPAAGAVPAAALLLLGMTVLVALLFRLRVTAAASPGSTSRPTEPTWLTAPVTGDWPGTCTGPAGSGSAVVTIWSAGVTRCATRWVGALLNIELPYATIAYTPTPASANGRTRRNLEPFPL